MRFTTTRVATKAAMPMNVQVAWLEASFSLTRAMNT